MMRGEDLAVLAHMSETLLATCVGPSLELISQRTWALM